MILITSPSLLKGYMQELGIFSVFTSWRTKRSLQSRWVTALLCYALEVDPFNQPNVTEAKEQTNLVLESKQSLGDFRSLLKVETDDYQIFSNREITSINQFFEGSNHYFAVMAYLTRGVDDLICEITESIKKATNKPTTFGWGPRFLHSTGQFHKGGQPNGAFIQVTADSEIDLEVPGKSFSFYQLNMAQAIGDGIALRKRDYPFMQIIVTGKQKQWIYLYLATSSYS